MKKYSIYIGFLALGLLLGYFFFGKTTRVEKDHDHTLETGQMWTCSMDPQVMLPEPGDCPICGMDLIPAVQKESELTPNQFQMTKNAIALADIQTVIVGKTSLRENTVMLSGKITENEESRSIQTSHFSGRIEKLYVNYTGEKVNKGQLLALVYSPELVAAQQELITASKLKKSQPDLYEAVKKKLLQWKLSENQIKEIESSRKIRANFPVYANVSGVVIEKMVEVGNHLREGQPMFKIANLNSVWASFDVYENMISTLRKGQNITITAKAFPGKKFKATISIIDPVMNEKTRTIDVKAVLRNNEGFKPGMFISGELGIPIISKNKTIKIPKSAVLWTGKRSIVYVKPDSTLSVFEMRDILLGKTFGDYYEILEGLKFGDEVVINGTFTVDASAQLQGKKSMMNKDIN
ncbi:efflux RND transporter periplasmic adaptor subunit [Aquimarina sp. MMG016]|uniref:efflux RND transporter periplasmic adaptor subunit n=1 Tax=Aquimarina sp. MMG016 TaxID=2822690 RepID=UPI001B3A2A17|nr:efflux RND transporter periplasmic adaptor subunit [Aquimarina sp. MMG016]MBQ4820798.1 efflux RND transporter periplasmic adaptor subunit [Aquimarina sp. MMG016]